LGFENDHWEEKLIVRESFAFVFSEVEGGNGMRCSWWAEWRDCERGSGVNRHGGEEMFAVGDHRVLLSDGCDDH
jgi:hypothetical protein